jgi:hypothetical protein
MDQLIDLDAAASLLEHHAEGWRALGLAVGPITWADGQTTVNAVTTDRSAVRGDYSCAIKLSSGAQEGHLVLYAGGWCDRTYWSGEGDAFIDDAPGWNDWLDLRRFEAVVEEFGRLFTQRG